jgi:hypothetical protein
MLTTTEMAGAGLPVGSGARATQLTSLPDDPVQSQALPPLADTRVKGDGTSPVT